jgi:hypothetical protein
MWGTLPIFHKRIAEHNSNCADTNQPFALLHEPDVRRRAAAFRLLLDRPELRLVP